MKVAVITQYFPTSAQPWAGHSAYQTLREAAKHCDLRVFYPQAVYPSFLRPAAARASGMADQSYQPAGVSTQYIPYPALPVVSRPLNGWNMYRKLLPHVRAFAPDVIANYVIYPDGYAAVRMSEELKVPVLLTAIGSDLNRISDPLCGVLTRSALRRANYVVTVSNDLLHTARAVGASAERSEATLNGSDTAIFYPRDRAAARAKLGVPHEQEVVLYVGRLDMRKGLRELVEAIASLRPSRPRLHCYLLGGGPDKPALESAVAAHGIQDTVTFVPAAPTSTVAEWMGAADLLTLPSYKEGCPNVVIEALSSGRPIVATHVGGIPELMDEQVGRLVPAHDAKALAAALADTLDTEWDSAAIAALHHRSWADVSHDLLQILAQTVKDYAATQQAK